jgi:hypothetical protein
MMFFTFLWEISTGIAFNWSETKNSIYMLEEKNHKRFVFWVILGLLLFLLVWYPLYGAPLRSQLGALFDRILNLVGTFLMLAGILSFIFGLLCLFSKRLAWGIKLMVIGALMVTAGSWLGTPVPADAPISNNREPVPKGYS